jgi:hypothetical protein
MNMARLARAYLQTDVHEMFMPVEVSLHEQAPDC